MVVPSENRNSQSDSIRQTALSPYRLRKQRKSQDVDDETALLGVPF
jgi:hypothetical protein